MKSKIALAIATGLGSGYVPVGPGTAGSIVGLLIAAGLVHWAAWAPLCFGLLALGAIIPGIWASGVTAAVSGRKDPSLVVVDEIIGQWITLAGATVLNWKSWLAAFLLFRALDIWKPWPARQLEALPGGTGIVADDVMAGIYGALVLYAAGCLNLY
ncbi:MAG TPA: phosphatidylglycerophosphatase A [Bryobacteraceae bacterium]|nr:phosphatidylglycerophosphatase A [Bryobacteraceae bacterium]